MKKQIVNFSVFQSAKVAAAMYFVITIPFVLIFMLIALVSPQPGLSVFMLILAPILYAIFGFIFTAIGAWVYNLVAARIGGIEFTTAET